MQTKKILELSILNLGGESERPAKLDGPERPSTNELSIIESSTKMGVHFFNRLLLESPTFDMCRFTHLRKTKIVFIFSHFLKTF